MFRDYTLSRHYEEPPQSQDGGANCWVTRGANFAIVCCKGGEGACLRGVARDEQIFYALEGGVHIETDGHREALDAEDLVIVPPGAWTLHFARAGLVVQLVTAVEAVTRLAVDATGYAHGAAEVAPLQPGPGPAPGNRLRRHSTREAHARGGMVHAFRTSRLMMVPYARFLQPRDETQLTPHAHAGFEQGSVALEGRWLHHLRVPWTSDRRAWRPDVHLEVDSPSTLIIPAGVIHTSQGIAGAGMRLIDVFAPPREDFAQRGWVVNAADYPSDGIGPPAVPGEADAARQGAAGT